MNGNVFIDEIRATRDRIARECGYDLHKIMERAQQAYRELGFTNRVKVSNADTTFTLSVAAR